MPAAIRWLSRSVRVSRLLDVRLSCLRDSERTVENGSRVHFCHGTAARLAKVVLLDRDALAPGESAYAQLRFTEDVAAKCGDRFVIRFYSPLETIGGGIILDDAPARHKRNDAAVLSALAVRENGSGAGARAAGAGRLGYRAALGGAARRPPRPEETRLAPELTQCSRTARPPRRCRDASLPPAVLDALWARCEALLTDYHAKNPLHAGVRAAELRQRLFRSVEPERADALLALFCARGGSSASPRSATPCGLYRALHQTSDRPARRAAGTFTARRICVPSARTACSPALTQPTAPRRSVCSRACSPAAS